MAYIKKLKDNELIGGTDNTDVYPVTSTEAVYNRENVSQEYINNHVDGSKIVDGTITTGKIANNAVTMGKLDNYVQSEIQKGAQRAWNPRGAYNEDTVYGVNDLVYHKDTNSSYISLQANNQGHNPAWQSATGGWWMKVLDGSYVNLLEEELQQLVDSISDGTQQQVEELNEALEALEAQADQSRQDIQDIVDSLAVVQTTGQSTSDVMSQKAVTDELDEIDSELTIYEFLKDESLTCGASNARFYAPLINGKVYKIVIERVSGSNNIGVYAYQSISDNTHVDIGNLLSTENSKEFVWVCNGYQYIGIYSSGSSATAKISIYVVSDRKLSDKVANIPETVINFTDIRKAILVAGQAININMDIAVNDIFKVSVSDFGDVQSYTISTWSEADRGGIQLESFTNITDLEKTITIGASAKCLRIRANGYEHTNLPGIFVVSKGIEMSITDAFAFVFGSLSIIPPRKTAPSVLSNGMIWLEVGDGMVMHIVSDSVTDTSSTFTDELGNMIVCSSVSKDGDYLSLSSQNSALELPDITLSETFSMFMKFKLKNNTQTSCYMALFNYNETTAYSQVSFIYNYKNTSSMLQVYIDGVAHNSITLSDTNVHELFVKYENTVITVYLDGVQVQKFSQDIKRPVGAVNALGNSFSKSHPCAMDLREFRLYNRAINIEDLDI